MLGFCLMAVSGNPLWLLAAFFLAGIGKGSTLNASNVLAGKAPDRTRSLNLIHAAYAVGALLSPLANQQKESIPGICHAVELESLTAAANSKQRKGGES